MASNVASNVATVKVHLDIDLNGEPVTRVLEMPASIESLEKNQGLVVHLHLDTRKLAKVIAPFIAQELPTVTDRRSDGKVSE